MVSEQTLKITNWTAAAIHFTQAAYWIYVKNQRETFDTPLEIYTNRIKDVNGVPTVINESVGDKPDLETLLITFFLVTGAFHTFYALDIGGLYSEAIYAQNNMYRWLEYSITATIMINIVARSAGVNDQEALILMNAATVGTMLQGQVVETALANRGIITPVDKNKTVIAASLAGWVLMLSVFGVIIKKFNETIADVETLANVDIPDWIPAVVWSQFIFYNIFGFWQLWHILQSNNPNFDYSNIEMGYNVLSITSKTVLGGILGYGLQQANNRDTSSSS